MFLGLTPPRTGTESPRSAQVEDAELRVSVEINLAPINDFTHLG